MKRCVKLEMMEKEIVGGKKRYRKRQKRHDRIFAWKAIEGDK
jgi:hypothetical protein